MMQPYWSNGVSTLYQGDARALPVADKSVHCVVTSPPYWGLRDYGLSDGIGLELTLAEWLDNIVAAGREVRRVLRDDGTFWLNLGDAYAGSGVHASHHANPGISKSGVRAGHSDYDMATEKRGVSPFPPKSLMGQPWRAAFALQDDGWILRSAIVWHKPNPMPESVTDRPTSAYEMVFLLTKQGRYFYDAEAVRQPESREWFDYGSPKSNELQRQGGKGWNPNAQREGGKHTGANLRNVWSIPTQGRPEAHFATFPDELPRGCILAGTKAGDAVLDPFVGSGTTVAVAQQLGRHGVGIDLNPEYLAIARRRLESIPLPFPAKVWG